MFALLKKAVWDFLEDDVMTLGAAVAFWATVSIAPVLLLLLWISNLLGAETQQQLVDQLVDLLGVESREVVHAIVQNARERPDAATVAGLVSIATVVFGATAIFGQVQHAMNVIWDVQSAPDAPVRDWFRKRLLALVMLVFTGLLLLASLAADLTIAFVRSRMGTAWADNELLLRASSTLVPLAAFTVLFATVFRILPDAQTRWRETWLGGLVTAVLFMLGKWVVGLYLANSGVGSVYGAAGSLLVLLVWFYYSSLIVFFGAELTQAWARQHGVPISPVRGAVRANRKSAPASKS